MRFTHQLWSGLLLASLIIQLQAEPAPATAPIPPSLVGHWFNTEENDTVGLLLNADLSCELYTNRLTAPKATKACKYAFYKDNTYLIYLKGSDGVCNSAADFEFHYVENLGQVVLDVGNGSQFAMSKKAQSELIKDAPAAVEQPAILKPAAKHPKVQ